MEHHWKELIPVDRYKVRSNGVLHDFDRKVLTLLYQPLVGYRAYSLYMTLWSELEQNLWGEETTHHSLMAIMQCSLKDIYHERLKLEGIGLLKTYITLEEESRLFIYELQAPLTPARFFTDGVFNVFLYNRVGRNKFNKLKSFFSSPEIDMSKFSPITRSFNDIFQSVHPEHMVVGISDEAKDDLLLSNGYAYVDRNEKGTYVIDEDVFDFQLFFAGLSANMVPRRAINVKVKDAIKKLAFLYGIGPLEMQKLVISVIGPDEQIDIDALRKAARDWYQFERGETLPNLSARVQPLKYRTMNEAEPKTKEEQLIKQLETISPRQLLMDISGGAEPSQSDLQIIEDVMFHQKLPAGVVNVLIYYVMLRTDMKLTKAYVEKIAGHWARKKIRTVREAMELAKQEAREYQKWASEKEKSQKSRKKVIRKEMLPDWLNMDYSQKESEGKEEPAYDLELKRRELEERLKKYGEEK